MFTRRQEPPKPAVKSLDAFVAAPTPVKDQQKIKDILERASQNRASDEELDAAFNEIDSDKNGAISRKEWLEVFGNTDIFDIIPKRNPQNLQKNDWTNIKTPEVQNNVYVKLHAEDLDVVALSQPEMEKLEKKNRLLDVLGTEGQQVIVTGDTSVGKSTIINFLLGFPVNFEATGVGTRRPSIISLTKDPSADDPQFEVTFAKPDSAGRPSFDEKNITADRVREISGECNDCNKNPHFFEAGKEFDILPLLIRIRHKHIKYALRLVDLPGMTRRNAEPMAISKSFIKPGNICILVIGRDNAANSEWPQLAEEMAKCKKVLCLQNFGSSVMRDAGCVPNNVKELEGKLLNSHPDFCLTCVDFGLPYTPENVDAGRWKEASTTYPGDQKDWHDMLKKRLQVQTAMGVQAQKWSKFLQSEFSLQLGSGKRAQAGLGKVHKDLLEFQMDGIDGDISKMQSRVRQLIIEAEGRVQAAEAKLASITSQKIWHKLLAFLAKGLQRYFDTTQECESDLMDTATEVEKCGKEYWFNEQMDKDIKEFGKAAALLVEGDCKLACLASWFRLLDELSVMLAFSPMKCITKYRKTNAFDRMGSAASGTINTFDVMVELLCDKQSALFDDTDKKPKPPIVGLLHVFQKRIKFLMNRDIEQGFAAVEKSHEGRKHIFEFRAHTGLGEAEMTDLKTQLRKTIVEYAMSTVDSYINGEKDPETKATIPKSGICVTTRPGDAAGEGPLHWLQPFPLHYFNGQLPWRLLKMEEKAEKALAEAGGWSPDDNDDEDQGDDQVCTLPGISDEQLVDHIQCAEPSPCINASNSINFKLAMLSIRREIFHVDKDSLLLKYDMYSMKTLKAMQGEIMTFWKGASRRMAQELFDKERGWKFLCSKFPVGDDSVKGLEPAVNAILDILQRSDFAEDHCLTVQAEISKSGEWPKPKDPKRGSRSSCPGEWPGLPLSNYLQMLDDIVALQEKASEDGVDTGSFPGSKDQPMVGQRSWIRLAEEFALVVFQLASRNVTQEEARMAASSSGDAVDSGPMEIVTKLILHRMSAIGGKVTGVFTNRMKALYKRDVDLSIKEYVNALKQQGSDAQKPPDVVDGVSWDDFLRSHLVGEFEDETASFGSDDVERPSYLAKVLNDVLGSLDRHIAELTPIDPVVLNGRLPLAQLPLRLPSVEMTWTKGKAQFSPMDNEEARNQILNVTKAPLLNLWEATEEVEMKDHMKVELDEAACSAAKAQGDGPFANRIFLRLDGKTSEIAYKQIQTSNDNTISLWTNNTKAEEAPYECKDKPLAGNSLHFMMLRLHKSMHAAAIDYCRPRLRAMMSSVYQSDKLLDALHEVDFAAQFVEKAKQVAEGQMNEAKAHLQLLKEALAASEK